MLDEQYGTASSEESSSNTVSSYWPLLVSWAWNCTCNNFPLGLLLAPHLLLHPKHSCAEKARPVPEKKNHCEAYSPAMRQWLFSGQVKDAGLMAGWDDLSGLFSPQGFYDNPMIQLRTWLSSLCSPLQQQSQESTAKHQRDAQMQLTAAACSSFPLAPAKALWGCRDEAQCPELIPGGSVPSQHKGTL